MLLCFKLKEEVSATRHHAILKVEFIKLDIN